MSVVSVALSPCLHVWHVDAVSTATHEEFPHSRKQRCQTQIVSQHMWTPIIFLLLCKICFILSCLCLSISSLQPTPFPLNSGHNLHILWRCQIISIHISIYLHTPQEISPDTHTHTHTHTLQYSPGGRCRCCSSPAWWAGRRWRWESPSSRQSSEQLASVSFCFGRPEAGSRWRSTCGENIEKALRYKLLQN